MCSLSDALPSPELLIQAECSGPLCPAATPVPDEVPLAPQRGRGCHAPVGALPVGAVAGLAVKRGPDQVE